MFKSVLSQQVNGLFLFVYLLVASSSFFLFLFLLSVLWACLEITQNAQPHKLKVFPFFFFLYGSWCYQVKTVSLSIQSVSGSAIPAIWSHASAFPHVRSRHHVKKMPATCWYLTSLPQCLGVTSASAQARISLQLSGVTKGYIPRSTAYMPYWNAKCCLIFVFVLMFIKNLALRFNLSGLEAGFEKEKPSVHW